MAIYELNIDGPTFREQRLLLLELESLARRALLPVTSGLTSGDTPACLLTGLNNMLDGIADQAHDDHGIDCLLIKEN